MVYLHHSSYDEIREYETGLFFSSSKSYLSSSKGVADGKRIATELGTRDIILCSDYQEFKMKK